MIESRALLQIGELHRMGLLETLFIKECINVKKPIKTEVGYSYWYKQHNSWMLRVKTEYWL